LVTELARRNLVPAPRTDDATLLRRTTPDLAGRIPTLAEQDDFVAMSPSKKRERLVDRLLVSPRLHVAIEALLFSKSDRVQNEYLRDSSDRLVGALKTQSDDEAIGIAFRSVLSRPPATD
jgi:hypothetical protein